MFSSGTKKTKAGSGITIISLTGEGPRTCEMEIGFPDLTSARIVGVEFTRHRSLIMD
jgi:hypothetical protein